MKFRTTRSFFAIAMAFAMVLTMFSGIAGAFESVKEADFNPNGKPVSSTNKLGDKVGTTFEAYESINAPADDEIVTIMVELDADPSLKTAGSVKKAVSLHDGIFAAQKQVVNKIESKLNIDVNVKSSYALLFNGFSFEGEYSLIKRLNEIDGVRAFQAPVFSLPNDEINMSSSTQLVNAPQAWDLGYTGLGGTVAILDTGIRPTHEAFSVAPSETAYDVKALEAVFEQYGEYIHAGNDAEQLFFSEKIPFGWDYQYNDYEPNHESSDHGTHVAGTAAGNNGEDFKGIAYDAQIFAMQVFQGGGASWDTILKGLEDCVYFGIDAANMSLGSPAGFSSYYDESYAEVFDLMVEAGVSISASAGNEFSIAEANAWGGYQLGMNPDAGIVGSPSVWAECLSIASSDNGSLSAGTLTAYGESFGFSETQYSNPPIAGIASETPYTFVYCGLGGEADYAGVDLEGKVALVFRGEYSFYQKAEWAQDAGAVACIVANNTDGVINMDLSTATYLSIPTVSITQAAGNFLVENATDGVGEITISAAQFLDMSAANIVSSFSSRGTTTDLLMKPELTAPGGMITSSIGFGSDSDYETWSGTSMAAPHVTGGMTVVKEYVRECFPEANAQEVMEITNQILMSTATILDGELVRSQGAGLMNLNAAVTTNALLYADYDLTEGGRPKVELGESDDGLYTFSFFVQNFGEETITYDLSGIALVDAPISGLQYDGQPIYVTQFKAADLSPYAGFDMPETVTVEPGQTVEITVDADFSIIAEVLADYYPNGHFVEGYIVLEPQATESENIDATLSIPYLGFLGDWDKQTILDRGFYWQEAAGEDTLHSNPTMTANIVGFKSGSQIQGLGINPYVAMPSSADYLADRNAISPNGDGIFDAVNNLTFALIRNAKMVELDIELADGWHNLYTSELYQWRKEYVGNDGVTFSYSDLPINFTGEGISEGETAYIALSLTLDHDDYDFDANELGQWMIPVTLDTTAPAFNLAEDGYVEMLDENFLAYVCVATDAEFNNIIAEQAGFAAEKNVPVGVNYETDAAEIYVFGGDYAGNESAFKVDLTTGEVTEIDPPEGGDEEPAEETIYWSEYWEDDSTYGGWYVYDGDGDSYQWSIYNVADYAYEGVMVAGSQSFDNTAGVLTPDNWIFHFPTAAVPENAKLRFYAKDQGGYGEHIEFYVANADDVVTYGDLANMECLVDADLLGDNYEEFVVDLSDYAGQNVCVAWRHCDCSDGFYLFLDNIELYTPGEEGGEDPEDPAGDLIAGWYFETEEEVAEWTFVDADQDGFNWDWNLNIGSAMNNPSYEGEGCILSASYDNDTGAVLHPDNWAVSPEFEIPADAASAALSYYVAPQDPDYAADHYAVYALVGEQEELLYEETITAAMDGYVNRTVDLSAYAGETVSIAFRHYNCADMFFMKIDQVEVSATVETAPEGALAGWYFETEEEVAEWTFVDADQDGFNWDWNLNVGSALNNPPYEGEGCILSASYDNDTWTPLTPDNWAVSPAVEIPENAANVTLSYYVAPQDPDYAADHYAVYAMVGDELVPLFEETITAAMDGYANRTVDLSDFAGETINVAFRHYNCTDMFVMKIDQVEIFAEEAEEAQIHTVNFIDDLTGDILATFEVEHGDSVEGPNAPEHEGYEFVGWRIVAVEPEEGENAANGTNVSLENVICDMDCYAMYEAIYHTVTFVDGMTEEVIATQDVQETMFAEAPEAPAHDGYTFIGWTVDGEFVNVDAYPVMGEVTFVAEYSRNLYYVFFNTNLDANYFATFEVAEGESFTEFPEAPVVEGYVFTGDYEVTLLGGESHVAPMSGVHNITENILVTYIYEEAAPVEPNDPPKTGAMSMTAIAVTAIVSGLGAIALRKKED